MTTVYRGFTVPTTADVPSGPQLAQDLVDGVHAHRVSGTRFKKIRNTAAGGGVGSTPINLFPTYTIPASPFGPGVPYVVRIRGASQCQCPPGTGFNLQARVDGTSIEEVGAAHTGSSTAFQFLEVAGAALVSNPDVTHTVSVTISGQASITVMNSLALHAYIELTPAEALP